MYKKNVKVIFNLFPMYRHIMVSYILLLIITSVTTYGQQMCKPCICEQDADQLTARCSSAYLNITLNTVPKYNSSDILSIDMSGQPLQELTELSHNMPKLEKAIFQNCSIHLVHKNAFHNMTRLRELDMSYNNVHTLHADTFKEMPNVKYILLNCNKIKSVTIGLFSRLQRLEELNLANNLIANVEADAFPVAGNLQVLNLSNNSILWIHASTVKQLTSIGEFFLSGNYNENLATPLKCENVPLQRESENICGNMCRNISYYEFFCLPELDDIIKKSITDNTKVICTISSYPANWKRIDNINEVRCDDSTRNDFSKTIIFLCNFTFTNTANLHCDSNRTSSNIFEKDNDILKRHDIILTLCCTTWGLLIVLVIILGTVIITVVLLVTCSRRRNRNNRIPKFPTSIGRMRLQTMNRGDGNVLRRELNTEAGAVSQSSDEDELQEPPVPERQELRESQTS